VLPEGMVTVQLDGGVQMVPLGSVMRKQYGIPFLPLTDEGRAELPSVLRDLCSNLAAHGSVAYIEAEFFGGVGYKLMC
jgi:hypothetical protein